MRTVVAASVEELRAHEAAWRDLGARLPEPAPTFRPEFLLPGLRAFAAETRFVLVYRGEVLEGFFPLMATSFGPLPRARAWRFFQHPYAPLATPWVASAAAVAAFYDWLARSGRDVLELRQLPVGGRAHTLLVEEAFRRHHLSWVGDSYGRAQLVPHPEGHEAYLRSMLGGERRKKFRNLRKRLGGEAGLTARELAPGADVGPWIQAFLALEASGWKGREGTAASQSPGTRSFLDAMLRGFHARGDLEMISLDRGDRPVAMKVNLWDGRMGYTYKIAYDEAFAAFSPGLQLELENIRLAHEPGAGRGRGMAALDSCTAPGPTIFRQLWNGLAPFETRVISVGTWRGDAAVSLRPLVRWLSRLKSKLVARRS